MVLFDRSNSRAYMDSDYAVDGRTPYIAKIFASDVGSLPSATYFNDIVIIIGSEAELPDGTKYGFDGTNWILQDQSPFSNVYTKSEVNALINPITDDITSLDGRVSAVETDNNNQDAYIYALIGRSSLNYLPDTVWEGATTAGSGYICQNLSINLPAGNYIWKMQRDGNTSTSFVIKDTNNTELYRVNRGAGVNDITQSFTISNAAASISIYAGYSITYENNMIFKDLSTSNRILRQINQINEFDVDDRDRLDVDDRDLDR